MKSLFILSLFFSNLLSSLHAESCYPPIPPPPKQEERCELSKGKKAFCWVLATLITMTIGIVASSADKGESAPQNSPS